MKAQDAKGKSVAEDAVGLDRVDLIIEQWARERPGMDLSAMETIGRILRTARHIDNVLSIVFAKYGLDFGLFDVLASLRRQGKPYQLPPSELKQWCMLTSGAMTKRLDRLETAGLINRKDDPADRRGVIIELTAVGLEMTNNVVVAHVENERQILSSLSKRQQRDLAELLRPLLVQLERINGERGRLPTRAKLNVAS